jgi:pimeloyl-ACP methyl ester carboxylesterase
MNAFKHIARHLAAFLLVAAIQIPVQAASTNIQNHEATTNGITLHYLQAGQGAETPVFLLHGYAETSHMWRPLIGQLADRRIVIAPDLRGAGASSKPLNGYDKKTMAQDIHALVQ